MRTAGRAGRSRPWLKDPRRDRSREGRGQVLVLFALLLLVLLGVAALSIDYASWLLTDRSLQNVADHAALAGASEFGNRITQGTCSGGAGQIKCRAARAQAWASIDDELSLGLSAQAITDLSMSDSGPSGTTGVTDSNGVPFAWQDRIWVTTPPPTYAAYTATAIGGRYSQNFGIVFARVDRDVPSFIAGALGVRPQPRHGWATAGALPTDYALQVFCRNGIAPQSGACGGSGQTGLVIDGQGGIRLLRGDIASNESIKVTAQSGSGVILESGNAFVVQGQCSSSSWNCPQVPATTGGLADADPVAYPTTANNKNAFYMAPLPVPRYASPLDSVSVSQTNCNGADPTHLCVPYRPAGSNQPGSWSCSNTDLNNLCGDAVVPVSGGQVTCVARVGGTPNPHLVAWGDGAGANGFGEQPDQPNGEDYKVLDDDPSVPDPDTTAAANPPNDYVYMSGTLNASGGSATQSVTYNLRPPFGIPTSGGTTVRYVAFKTDGTSALSSTGNAISVSVALLQGGSSIYAEPVDAHDLLGTPTLYSFSVPANVITNYTSLSLRFMFHTTVDNGSKRGGGIAWAEAQTPNLDPALPPMIPPGYYHSIVIPDDSCAILDPTAVYSGLKAYQVPGIYRFGGGSDAEITLGAGSFLIGSAVTLVFDPDFPDPSGGRGIVVGGNGAFLLNTSKVPGVPPCTPTEPETATYNPAQGYLTDLPYSSVCAAWGIDPSVPSGIRPGSYAWPSCDPADLINPHCVERAAYSPTTGYRGITFYLTPSGWPPSGISGRFQLGGGSGAQPGIAFRGVLYAPYDDVKISGGNGFNTVGQVLAWTAKFNGGSSYIDLDFPYQDTAAPPYLLEPTVDH